MHFCVLPSWHHMQNLPKINLFLVQITHSHIIFWKGKKALFYPALFSKQKKTKKGRNFKDREKQIWCASNYRCPSSPLGAHPANLLHQNHHSACLHQNKGILSPTVLPLGAEVRSFRVQYTVSTGKAEYMQSSGKASHNQINRTLILDNHSALQIAFKRETPATDHFSKRRLTHADIGTHCCHHYHHVIKILVVWDRMTLSPRSLTFWYGFKTLLNTAGTPEAQSDKIGFDTILFDSISDKPPQLQSQIYPTTQRWSLKLIKASCSLGFRGVARSFHCCFNKISLCTEKETNI